MDEKIDIINNTTTGLKALRNIAWKDDNVTDVIIKLEGCDIFITIWFLGGYRELKKFYYPDLEQEDIETVDYIYNWITETIHRVSSKMNKFKEGCR